MHAKNLTLCAAIALIAGAPAALANPGFYYGIGLGFSSMESFDDNPATLRTSDADTAVLGLTFGYRWEMLPMFYGIELDADLSGGADFDDVLTGTPCSAGANGPYFCTHDATLRFRGLVGQALAGGTEVFGTLGLAVVYGDSATNTFAIASTTNTGYTVGLGLQQDFAAGFMGRIELIYDQADNSNNPGGAGFDPDYKALTLKASILF